MTRFGYWSLVISIVGLGFATPCAAQVSNTQRFRVAVPVALAIQSPANQVTITHDETDNNQVFPPQAWQVQANAIAGATVQFSTNHSFWNASDNTFRRDARLELAIGSSDAAAAWNVTLGSDETDYAAVVPDEVATVEAVSARPGDASFNLTVTFLTGDHSTLASGVYRMRVTGTITAN